ncbi:MULTISPECIES: group II intron reverse transcriptase/maturase [Paraburkholderia]|uniref:group II intron reverse transcriptase/maturase n=1 Tax=Paraburkholderia TaxID=1822464 RepID=UPI002252D150|nr:MULTISPECIES: group II intron reverse transcriptase/maturase [Paraburkholderia]MCX4159764.1 group II intron reverse transcriptase/maturase [Paraburkholderia aspalathi]MDN7169161.1 group II intron reverse transcriptase/maturase [Paraburkholderia sp. SECH2]MDQ6397649.1 group II intron reverse transcriptase/maturase [Paraburkholderia aspalathi]
MSMQQALRQKPVQMGRVGAARGEAARGTPACDEAGRPRHESGNTGSALLEAAQTRENLKQAFKRVRSNKGAAGVDGLDIDQKAHHLVTAWPAIREQLLRGTYRPSPVRRVTIPKPDGGERELGIPTVTDRLIQQALLQVLQPVLDPTFSEHSYGFRPGRRAHDAVLAAQSYVQSGRRIVVDVDLEKFFDRVNHDILIDRLQKRLNDAGVIWLIRAYLNSGIMDNGVVQQRDQGTPQGGPLSPLLANVLLDEVDKELERRGHCFARYADDANVYVRSRRAGERVMALLRRLYGRLRLKVNETKSAMASVFGRKFLGYSLWVAPGGVVKRKVAAKPLLAFRHRIRELTRRSGGRSMSEVVEWLRSYVQGWKAYFRLAQTPKVWRKLDEWLRHRLRAIQLKHWRRGTTIYRELRALGAPDNVARQVAANSRCWWRNSDRLLNSVLTIAYFDQLGVPRLS